MHKFYGAAFFKDGHVAAKEFVFAGDFNKGSGPFYGYSTYQFEDGSTITARFAGTSRAGPCTVNIRSCPAAVSMPAPRAPALSTSSRTS
jgi:hypothetical protein